MKALLSICLFWVVSGKTLGVPMNCYQCMGSDCAAPKIQKCKAHEDACYSAVTETTLVSSLMLKYNMTIKQCAPAHFCLQNYVSVSTLAGGKIRSNAQCCYTNLCNNMPVSLPKTKDFPFHKVQCPACFVVNSHKCQKKETIKCTGGETKCIESAADISIDPYEEKLSVYFQGCTTPNACFIPLSKKNATTYKVNFTVNKLKCT